jgi:carbon storage regulator
MLVLRRKRGESIVIGRDGQIQVKVLRDENGIITLGVQAPSSIQVDRLEVFENRQNKIPPNII